KRRYVSAVPKRSNRKFSRGCRRGKTGFFSGPTPSVRKARSNSTGRDAVPNSTRGEHDVDQLFRTNSQQRQPLRRSPPAARTRGLAAEVPAMVERNGAS